MNCAHCEERMSDCLEVALRPYERRTVHWDLQSCRACSDLHAGMTDVLAWARTCPVHERPSWLPARILANTPRLARERWTDTIAVIWKWIADPRPALGLFTEALV